MAELQEMLLFNKVLTGESDVYKKWNNVIEKLHIYVAHSSFF